LGNQSWAGQQSFSSGLAQLKIDNLHSAKKEIKKTFSCTTASRNLKQKHTTCKLHIFTQYSQAQITHIIKRPQKIFQDTQLFLKQQFLYILEQIRASAACKPNKLHRKQNVFV
jgi:hypothetical protein